MSSGRAEPAGQRMSGSEWAALMRGDANKLSDALAKLDTLLAEARTELDRPNPLTMRAQLTARDNLTQAIAIVARMRGAKP